MITAQELRALVDYDPISGLMVWIGKPNKCLPAGRPIVARDAYGYLQVSILGKKYKVHRLAWLYVTGDWPADEIDHINNDRGDNRFENLRAVTHKQNSENQKTRRPGKFKGVYWYSKTDQWVAFCKHQQKLKNLGYYPSLIDAVAARIRYERVHFTSSPFNV